MERRANETVFVVRMWRAEASGSADEWRGYCDHVATRSRTYFSNFGALVDFMLAERERPARPED